MKKLFALLLAAVMVLSVCSFASAETVEEIIAQAQTMTLEELFQKAIEESNGKRFDAVGNSSRGKSAGASFVEMLQKMDPSYTIEFDWGQPKNNTIFEALDADVKSSSPVSSILLWIWLPSWISVMDITCSAPLTSAVS